jgi:(p)ppGpp synthase/HD superfamily hydrolase
VKKIRLENVDVHLNEKLKDNKFRELYEQESTKVVLAQKLERKRINKQVELALEIAKEAHKGQFRHDNKTPYIEHPLAVAKPFRRPLKTYPTKEDREIYISTALLHDVIEDSNIDKQNLIDRGINPFVANLVEVLTHKERESYLDYILRVKRNYMALWIKIGDIKHNLSTLESKKKAQRDKYLLALYILEN